MQLRLSRGMLIVALVYCWIAQLSHATEMEFELKDNAMECFHEEIEKDKRCFLEFQVSNSPQNVILGRSTLIKAHHTICPVCEKTLLSLKNGHLFSK